MLLMSHRNIKCQIQHPVNIEPNTLVADFASFISHSENT